MTEHRNHEITIERTETVAYTGEIEDGSLTTSLRNREVVRTEIIECDCGATFDSLDAAAEHLRSDNTSTTAEHTNDEHEDPDDCIAAQTISRDTDVELPGDSVFSDILVPAECTVCEREFTDAYTYNDTFAEDNEDSQ